MRQIVDGVDPKLVEKVRRYAPKPASQRQLKAMVKHDLGSNTLRRIRGRRNPTLKAAGPKRKQKG